MTMETMNAMRRTEEQKRSESGQQTMERLSIAEVIVVEGKNDTARLKRFFDCDTVETDGGRLRPETLDLIRQAAKTRGVIVFTDPDGPGERLRRKIMEALPEAGQAFVPKEKARTTKKVGIEHASREDLEAALSACVTFTHRQADTLSWSEYLDLGLNGNRKKREAVCRLLHMGPCNAKTCFRRMNLLGITKEEAERLMQDAGSDCDGPAD